MVKRRERERRKGEERRWGTGKGRRVKSSWQALGQHIGSSEWNLFSQVALADFSEHLRWRNQSILAT